MGTIWRVELQNQSKSALTLGSCAAGDPVVWTEPPTTSIAAGQTAVVTLAGTVPSGTTSTSTVSYSSASGSITLTMVATSAAFTVTQASSGPLLATESFSTTGAIRAYTIKDASAGTTFSFSLINALKPPPAGDPAASSADPNQLKLDRKFATNGTWQVDPPVTLASPAATGATTAASGTFQRTDPKQWCLGGVVYSTADTPPSSVVLVWYQLPGDGEMTSYGIAFGRVQAYSTAQLNMREGGRSTFGRPGSREMTLADPKGTALWMVEDAPPPVVPMAPPLRVATADAGSSAITATYNLDTRIPDLLTIEPVSSIPPEMQPYVDDVHKREPGLSRLSWARVLKPKGDYPFTISSAYAREEFANKVHDGLREAYSILAKNAVVTGVVDAESFWKKAGVADLHFYYKHSIGKRIHNHVRGKAVDFDYQGHPYVPIVDNRNQIASEDGVGHGRWGAVFVAICTKILEVYKRAALFTGLFTYPEVNALEIMKTSADVKEQVSRFKHVHQSLRAYFSMAYDVDLKGGSDTRWGGDITAALRLPPASLDAEATRDGAAYAVGTAAPVGTCSQMRHPWEALARAHCPELIAYEWYDESRGDYAFKLGSADGVKRVMDSKSLGQTDNDYEKLLRQIKVDHDLFRFAVLHGTPGDTHITYDGKDPAFGTITGNDGKAPNFWSRDPCNGFMRYHPAIVYGMQKQTGIRCLGFSQLAQWNAPGEEIGDMMHFDM